MTFGQAVDALKKGERVERPGWNGKGMWIAYCQPADYAQEADRPVNEPTLPFLVIHTPTGDVVPWVTSQMDVLAEDWEIVS